MALACTPVIDLQPQFWPSTDPALSYLLPPSAGDGPQLSHKAWEKKEALLPHFHMETLGCHEDPG